MWRTGFGATLALMLAVPAAATPPNVITKAEYTEPTSRYNHGVLGDNAEWGALQLTVDQCVDCETVMIRSVTIRLPETRVFEDIAPRLVDVDGDTLPEVLVIESDLAQGARLALYDESGLMAATPFIGRTNRWLAPLGVADLDGDGQIELAYIDRPHLAKILRIWRYEDNTLVPVADQPGLTNHRIGENYISGGIRTCGGGAPEIITANANWSRLFASTLADGAITSRDIGPHTGPESFAAALDCR